MLAKSPELFTVQMKHTVGWQSEFGSCASPVAGDGCAVLSMAEPASKHPISVFSHAPMQSSCSSGMGWSPTGENVL